MSHSSETSAPAREFTALPARGLLPQWRAYPYQREKLRDLGDSPTNSDPSKRQYGHTTRQILAAPIDSVFVWCSSRLLYANALVHELGRDDLRVLPLGWLTMRNVCGFRGTGVTVDHFSHINREAYEALIHLQRRNIYVCTWVAA